MIRATTALATFGSVLLLSGCDPKHDSDQTLINRFETHKETFEKLKISILEHPGLQRAWEAYTWPEDPTAIGVSRLQIETYRKWLTQVGCKGFEADGTNIYFGVTARGLAIGGGSSKGIFFGKPARERVVSSTDAFMQQRVAGQRFRKIVKDWYIYFGFDG